MLEAQAPVGLHASQDPRAVLKREAGFRDRCARDLGRRRFAETLGEASADGGSLDAFVTRAAKILGLDAPAEPAGRDPVDDILLALASPLRLGLLSLSSEAMLRALAIGERVARRVLSLSSDEPTLQAVHKIVTGVGPTLRLLAQGDQPVDLPEGDHKVAALGSPELTFAAYLALREARGPGGMLAALEKAIEPALSVADRSVLLSYLGGLLAHVPTGGRRRGAAARGGARSRP